MTSDGARGRSEELKDDLEATSDSVIADAQRLIEIEQEKQSRIPGDPLQPVLGREARQLTEALVRKAVAEEEISDRLGRERGGN